MWREIWFDKNIAGRIQGLLNSGGYKIDADKNRIVPNAVKRLDDPWIHFGASTNGLNCHLWTRIMFQIFNLIPSFCRFNCHKVVTKPRNFKEMFQYYGLINAIPFNYGHICPIPGKCGIDRRDYTGVAYHGFCYADSLDRAQEYYDIVYKSIHDCMPDAIVDDIHLADTMIIKKACTEMEAQHPTTDSIWESMTPKEIDLEKRLSEIFCIESELTIQADWVKNNIVHTWLRFANMIGDSTATEMTGKDFTVHAVTYHNTNDNIKKKED